MTRSEIVSEIGVFSLTLGMVGWMAYLFYRDFISGVPTITVLVGGLAVLSVGTVWVVVFFTSSKIGRRLEKAIRQRLRQLKD